MQYTQLLSLALIPLALGCQSSALTAAKLYLQKEEPQKAKDQLVLALETEPQNAEAHFLLGKIYSGEGDYAAMDASFARTADLSVKFREEINQIRDFYWAREYNAGVTIAQGEEVDLDRALTRFKSATLIRPQRLEAWRNLAYVYYQLNQEDRAITAYQRVVLADSIELGPPILLKDVPLEVDDDADDCFERSYNNFFSRSKLRAANEDDPSGEPTQKRARKDKNNEEDETHSKDKFDFEDWDEDDDWSDDVSDYTNSDGVSVSEFDPRNPSHVKRREERRWDRNHRRELAAEKRRKRTNAPFILSSRCCRCLHGGIRASRPLPSFYNCRGSSFNTYSNHPTQRRSPRIFITRLTLRSSVRAIEAF